VLAWYVPNAHAEHSEAPEAEYAPAAQLEHAVAPVFSCEVPVAHDAHAVADAAE